MIQPTRYHRKVIQVSGDMSPNVRYGLVQKRSGVEPTGEDLIPGLIGYYEYKKREALWDEFRKSVSIYGRFYEGAELRMYPDEWIDEAVKAAARLANRRAKSMGVDSAEGGDNTVWAWADDRGLIGYLALKTKDTSMILGRTIALMKEHGIEPKRVMFDAGGGGTQHAHYLRNQGYDVQTARFGAAATKELTAGFQPVKVRKEAQEVQYAYVSLRVEMYHSLAQRIDPALGNVWGLPRELLDRPRADGKATLRTQMRKIPKIYDDRGRMVLPPKSNRDGKPSEQTKDRRETLIDMVGCSPDELEAVVLASYGLTDRVIRFRIGAL